MSKDKNIVDPLDASLDEVVSSIFKPAALNSNKIKGMSAKMAPKPATPVQLVLDIGVEIQRDVNGVEMGVLENGIPFLTQRGLAKLSGASRKEIFDITQEWGDHYDDDVISKGRLSFIRDLLFKNGYRDRSLYVETIKDGSPHYAYPDVVCMAILEYYAFESKSPNKEAISAYRRLATFGLQKFIYEALGYTPADPWKFYHARVSILKDSSPDGYFTVFHEIAPMIVDLINGGLAVNDHTVPDGSVGIHWGKFWDENGLDTKIKPRIKYAHYYPAEFPQSRSNPQPAWAYPEEALPDFRRWFRHVYLMTKFPKYILTKSHVLGGQEKAIEIGNMYQPKQIEQK